MSGDSFNAFCMVHVPFHPDGTIDEPTLRVDLRRLIAARNDLFLASGGAGEAHVLSTEELYRVYKIGAEEGKGKVRVFAGLRESRSAAAMYEIAKAAADAGVDAVQLYQLDNGHGMIPTLCEQQAYWHELLGALTCPVAIAIHYGAKFKLPTRQLLDLIAKYPHIVALNLVGCQIDYFLELRGAVPAHIPLYCGLPEFAQLGTLGAAGYINPANNLIPFICRAMTEAFAASDIPTFAQNNRSALQFLRVMNQWAPSTARWVKMAMKLNGTGNGVLRLPYLLPPEDELQKMQVQLDAHGIYAQETKAKTYVLERV
jgi:4-hydroxy-tetrahydrodipicolinate synthase